MTYANTSLLRPWKFTGYVLRLLTQVCKFYDFCLGPHNYLCCPRSTMMTLNGQAKMFYIYFLPVKDTGSCSAEAKILYFWSQNPDTRLVKTAMTSCENIIRPLPYLLMRFFNFIKNLFPWFLFFSDIFFNSAFFFHFLF